MIFRSLLITAGTLLSAAGFSQKNTGGAIFKSEAYSVYKDSIVQGQFVSKALSATELVSDYKSPVNLFKSSIIAFKFSINGKDNEMVSGSDDHFNVTAAAGNETPLIKFGTAYNSPDKTEHYLQPNTALKVKLDMREVLASFADKGYFVTVNGDKIFKEDFKGVYIAGAVAPLTWDFDNLAKHKDLELKDDDKDGIYEITLILNAPEAISETATHWQLSKDISAFPQYSSGYTMSNALYNMALEEMIKAVEPDSTFRTGKEWAGVWTRDISYSIILSMAYLQPQVAKYSLLKKVNAKKKIIQDTGTGGAWPVSTDRMIWAVAAWELYKATGDMDWLQNAFTIIKNSIESDRNNVYDAATGLVKGESSFLDWREQTYPKWMQPADIFESKNLGTNVVHYQANIVLSKMAAILHKTEDEVKYKAAAEKIKAGINKYLWLPEQKYFGQYMYGRNYKTISPRSEALGEALSVIFDVADSARQKQVVANVPQTAFGNSCIYPQIPGISPYHNNAVWPFVQTYWLWAGAKAENERSVEESIAAIYRPAALFLTNKENFVADNGDFAGTVINSSNMLWSLSGNLSIVHKVLFGIRFNEANISFSPFVPKVYAGKRTLTNFKYRGAVLDIEMEGYGNKIKLYSVDGKVLPAPVFPAIFKGKHAIKIVLANNDLPATINKTVNYTTLSTPAASLLNNSLTWQAVDSAASYKIFKNGAVWKTTVQTSIPVSPGELAEYAVAATDKKGINSFLSEPVMVAAEQYIQKYEAEDLAPSASYPYKGFTGNGFIEASTTVNTVITIPVTITKAGVYSIDCRYANGNGPVNTENKCAVRTLLADKLNAGVIVMPQRATGEWSNWGYSNALKVYLTKGKHILSLEYLPDNENMNIDINQAMIDHFRLIKTGDKK